MKKRIMFTMDEELIRRLETMSKRTGYKKSEIVELAVKILINKKKVTKGENK